MAKVAEVWLWGERVGAVLWDESQSPATGTFEYDPDFCEIGLQIAPITMPAVAGEIYAFPSLPEKAFKRLPPCLSDSLPDDFGNAVIDSWLASQGRDPKSFTPVERLLYVGSRGMGALEYRPAALQAADKTEALQMSSLVELAGKILSDRKSQLEGLTIGPASRKEDAALQQLFKIGSSAGGARAKAIISINDATGEICSGQVVAPPGYSYWLFKFDVGDKAESLGDPAGFGRVEYAYHLMAIDAGVEMTECRLHEEGPRAHFMTRRFDRITDNPEYLGDKIHVQSLCAMDRADFNMPGAYSYEQALLVCRELGLSRDEQIQLYRRMVFNIVSRNQDDHTRNIAFQVWRDGVWRLTPAYDVCWSYNPAGDWTATHQMSANGKRDGFVLDDLVAVAKQIPRLNAAEIVEEVCDAVARWREFAAQAGVRQDLTDQIESTHRRYLRPGA